MPSSDTPTLTDIDQLTIDTIRTLSMDAVEAAKSGHPGTPMALAPVAYTVWKDFLRYTPLDPSWPHSAPLGPSRPNSNQPISILIAREACRLK